MVTEYLCYYISVANAVIRSFIYEINEALKCCVLQLLIRQVRHTYRSDVSLVRTFDPANNTRTRLAYSRNNKTSRESVARP